MYKKLVLLSDPPPSLRVFDCLMASVPAVPDPASAIETKVAEIGVDLVAQAASDANSILVRLLGPVASEVGDLLAMPFRERRMVRTAEMLRRVEVNVQQQIGMGAIQAPLPSRGVVPLLEAASLEEDEDLADRYVDLLSNAALGNRSQDLSSFASILSQLSPIDAQLLQLAFNHHVLELRQALESGSTQASRPALEVSAMLASDLTAASFGEGLRTAAIACSSIDLRISVDNLLRLGLVRDISVTEVDLGGVLTYDRNLEIKKSVEDLAIQGIGYWSADLNRPGSAFLQPTRDRVALSDLGMAFSRCVNPPGLELPPVVVSDY